MARIARPVQLPSGTWNIRWIDATGRRQSATFASHNDARQALARRQTEAAAIRAGVLAAVPPRKTFDDLTSSWQQTKGAAKRSTKDDESILRRHLTPAFGGLDLAAVTYARIEAFNAHTWPSRPCATS